MQTPTVIIAISYFLQRSLSACRSWLPNIWLPAMFTSMSSRTYALMSLAIRSLADKIQIMWCDQDKKMKALYDLLISMPPSRTLIFVKFKKTADFVDDYLYNLGLPSTSIHSDRTQSEREDALRSFKSGLQPILVATGVTARGLDVR